MSNAPSKPVSFSRPKVGYFSNRPRRIPRCVCSIVNSYLHGDDTNVSANIHIYRASQNYVNTDLKDRIRTVVSSIPRELCVRPLNGTVARWLSCVKHDGEQVETVL